MDNRNNEYISEALKIADDLMELANDEAGLADESGFGILLGVMRDCAYKIRRHAEKEGRKAKVAWVSAKAIMVIFALGALSILLASPASATIILSTDAGASALKSSQPRHRSLLCHRRWLRLQSQPRHLS